VLSKVFVFEQDHSKSSESFKKIHASVLRSEGDLEKLLSSPGAGSTLITPLFEEAGRSLVHVCLTLSPGTGKSMTGLALLALGFPSHPPLTLLKRVFSRVAFPKAVLRNDELLEALAAPNRDELIVGGTIQPDLGVMQLYRGDLEEIDVPLEWFSPSADGVTPDFQQFSIADYGHGVRLGEYEASTDAILYEFDPQYRKRIKERRRQEDKSFGACLRRLRIQRGLKQSDFSEVSAKEIGRIERGEVERVHVETVRALAKQLRVKPDEIEDY
jgi:DNA-binding Xre family transcriptional regulator